MNTTNYTTVSAKSKSIFRSVSQNHKFFLNRPKNSSLFLNPRQSLQLKNENNNNNS